MNKKKKKEYEESEGGLPSWGSTQLGKKRYGNRKMNVRGSVTGEIHVRFQLRVPHA